MGKIFFAAEEFTNFVFFNVLSLLSFTARFVWVVLVPSIGAATVVDVVLVEVVVKMAFSKTAC